MAYSRDPLARDPVTQAEITQYSLSVEFASWGTQKYPVPVDGSNLFTRQAFIPDVDLKTYDHGVLFIGTNAQADNAIIGEIYVDYTVEFHMPQPTKCAAAQVLLPAPSAILSQPTGTQFNIFGLDAQFIVVSPVIFRLQINAPDKYIMIIRGSASTAGSFAFVGGQNTVVNFSTNVSGGTANLAYVLFTLTAGSTLDVGISGWGTNPTFDIFLGKAPGELTTLLPGSP